MRYVNGLFCIVLLFGLVVCSRSREGEKGKANDPKEFAVIMQLMFEADEFKPYFLTDDHGSPLPVIYVDDDMSESWRELFQVTRFGEPVLLKSANEIDTTDIKSYYRLADYHTDKNSLRIQLFDPMRDILLNAGFKWSEDSGWQIYGTNVQAPNWPEE